MDDQESSGSSLNEPLTTTWAVPSSIPTPSTQPTAIEPRPAPVNVAVLGPAGLPTETGVPAADDTDIDPAPDLPQIPGYRIIRAIGGGGMGTVFKAIHLALNKIVALKLINAGWATDTDFRVRFDREAKTLAALEHTNIVPVFDAGAWQGLPYLTMKFVAGKTLYHRLETVSRDPRSAARILAQVARAVHYLHSQGIIHRDLKPLNILLTPDGTPLVADFGLVRPIDDDSDLSLTMVPLGTRQYMSPEQTRGGRKNYTTACDIWALGVILYELLAGHRPFGHDDPVELFRQIRYDPPPVIHTDRKAPPELDAIARKCLAKLPSERYATAEEVAIELDRWLAGEPINTALTQPAPTPVEAPAAPVVKKSRWFRVLLATGAGVLLVLGVAWMSGVFRNPPVAEAADPPPPKTEVPPRTVLERFAANELIVLTDAKGKPTGNVPPVAGHAVGQRTRDGSHEFFSTLPAIAPLSEEPFPFPLKIKANVAASAGTDLTSLFAVYVGRRKWEGGRVPHESLVWFGITPRFPAAPAQPQILCRTGFYWWEQDFPSGTRDWDEKKTPWKVTGAKQAGPRFVPIEIEVRADRIVGRIDGIEMKAVTTEMAMKEFWFVNQERPALGNYPFALPVFGPGIGLFVSNSNGIVTDMTVSKIND